MAKLTPQLVRLGAALLAAALLPAQAAPPFDSHLASRAESVRGCAEWYAALDAAVDAAQARDRLEEPVPGFPYLRVDPALGTFRPRAGRDERALHDFAERLLALDVEARRSEIANLPDAALARLPGALGRLPAVRRTRECGRLLREIDLAIAERRAWLVERAAVGGAAARYCEPTSPGRAREVGPDTLLVRLAPPGAGARQENAAAVLSGAGRSALGIGELSDREMEFLYSAHAPTFEVALAGDQDRFGALRLPRGGGIPEVDGAQQVVYRDATWLLEGERVLLRLEYTVWFPGPAPQALAWRATLGADGRALWHEARAGDVCRRYMLPRLVLAERPRLRLASGSHEVEAVEVVDGIDGVARYSFASRDELRSLPDLQGGRRSAFGPGGVR